MANPYFQFKHFTVIHDRCSMKVTTDGCLFGAWIAENGKWRMENGEWKGENGEFRAIDIGTGTGLLALMMAQKTDLHFDAVEIDPEAASQAKENVEASPWRERIRVINQDILQFENGNYDIIISNPPFYEKEIRSESSEKNVAHHSDKLGLDELLRYINDHLKSTGRFFLLLPFKRKKEFLQLMKKKELHIHSMMYVRQSLNHEFFRMMIMGGKVDPQRIVEDELSIWDEQQRYTPAFIDLLKEYYLYL